MAVLANAPCTRCVCERVSFYVVRVAKRLSRAHMQRPLLESAGLLGRRHVGDARRTHLSALPESRARRASPQVLPPLLALVCVACIRVYSYILRINFIYTVLVSGCVRACAMCASLAMSDGAERV